MAAKKKISEEELIEIVTDFFKRNEFQDQDFLFGWNLFVKTIQENKNPTPKKVRYINHSYSELFKYWNEKINPTSEKFWEDMEKNHLHFLRKDPLKLIVEQRQIKKIEFAIELRNNWDELLGLESVQMRISAKDLQRIKDLLDQKEIEIVSFLKKKMINRRIPIKEYQKFGAAYAYLSNCQLLDRYFTPLQREILLETWKNPGF